MTRTRTGRAPVATRRTTARKDPADYADTIGVIVRTPVGITYEQISQIYHHPAVKPTGRAGGALQRARRKKVEGSVMMQILPELRDNLTALVAEFGGSVADPQVKRPRRESDVSGAQVAALMVRSAAAVPAGSM